MLITTTGTAQWCDTTTNGALLQHAYRSLCLWAKQSGLFFLLHKRKKIWYFYLLGDILGPKYHPISRIQADISVQTVNSIKGHISTREKTGYRPIYCLECWIIVKHKQQHDQHHWAMKLNIICCANHRQNKRINKYNECVDRPDYE